ncbi:uncharacterized protein A1O9_03095 [Exophiala aquamarina CBS 119918]|uniref:Beta-lactamase-related domain-containing protein n=1 Tax=Exophiala aquamarina CBS 119918 TaxID=1182545 RepID=A0A072PQA2_9EURO|nr:uncharacterized protein A1O9_03095 [Exophiala aquamarina CBS 119918]KEF61528.1 hypothetical protein A1O9_03095 [Exophiala aquamarina CBS 119918]
MASFKDIVAQVLETAPTTYRGPGGSIAVVRDGELVGQQVWGYSNLDTQALLSPDTILPICSITKQMLCGLLPSLEHDPTPAMKARGTDAKTQFQDQLSETLGADFVKQTGLKIHHLTNNASGIRDYWALTVLWGAKLDQKFSMKDHIPKAIERTKSLHFTPGTEYSYSNINFVIVQRIIEAVSGQTLDELLAQRVFGPSSMKSAFVGQDSSLHPTRCVGYEGNASVGYFPAINRIEWAGDAGIVASLNDMIAYEKSLDRSWTGKEGWFWDNAQPPTYDDGKPAVYANGLASVDVLGVRTVRHGGALRGYRLHRCYAPQQRVSVIVMFNHEADAGAAASSILQKVLGLKQPETPVVQAGKEWFGSYFDEVAQMFLTVAEGKKPGEVVLSYVRSPEKVKLTDATHAKSTSLNVSLEGDVIVVERMEDNRIVRAKKLTPSVHAAKMDASFLGSYRCDEIDSKLKIEGHSGMLYGAFEGFLGTGAMHFVRHVGGDVWALECVRSMDATPPGDWTLAFKRDEAGNVNALTVGCWLARNLKYKKV